MKNALILFVILMLSGIIYKILGGIIRDSFKNDPFGCNKPKESYVPYDSTYLDSSLFKFVFVDLPLNPTNDSESKKILKLADYFAKYPNDEKVYLKRFSRTYIDFFTGLQRIEANYVIALVYHKNKGLIWDSLTIKQCDSIKWLYGYDPIDSFKIHIDTSLNTLPDPAVVIKLVLLTPNLN
jgi:hypothetical protein